MLRAAIIFFLVGILAYVFGAYHVAGLSLEIGQIFLYVFLALAIIAFVVNILSGRRTRNLLP